MTVRIPRNARTARNYTTFMRGRDPLQQTYGPKGGKYERLDVLKRQLFKGGK